MRSSSALALLFFGLVGVPVAAAFYLGTAGMRRERDFLIEQERAALFRRAEELRDSLVRALQEEHRAESLRDYLHYQPRYVAEDGALLATPLSAGADADRGIADRFLALPDGRLLVPYGTVDALPPEIRELAARRAWLGAENVPRGAGDQAARLPRTLVAANRRLLEGAAPGQSEGRDERATVIASRLLLRDASGIVERTIWFDDGYRLLQGFRIDVERLNAIHLAPGGRLMPRFQRDRLERAELVRDEALGRLPTGAYGLPLLLHLSVEPDDRNAPRVLLPFGVLLAVKVRAGDALARAVEAAEARVTWILAAMGAMVALGGLFAWRAVRAEATLAARKGEFVSAVSHELRTPITSIRMYADMLKEGWVKDSDTARDYFALISSESERLARLVNNVLDFSRIERGRKTFDLRLGDPAPVVRETAELLRPYLKEKGFALEVAVPETLPACSFDKDALVQVLVNLLDNSVKYGDGGGGGVKEVRVEAEARAGEIALRVCDRGPGVPAAERERIFLPFQRGSNAAAVGGSGLGLSLVRHTMEAHRGRVAVLDRAGGGAAFELSLPVG
ncbi:MAG: sensor histidine kinase [Planctomycetaceae bacterium]